jgi:CheY-like chemotaxis protein
MSRTVILIDDDQDDLDILMERISAIYPSFRCMSFRYPLEAMRVMLQDLILVPDFIFTDINMPELRGDYLVRELRQNQDFDNTEITVLSTAMPLQSVERMKQLGADYAFPKPTQLSEYELILREIFSNAHVG